MHEASIVESLFRAARSRAPAGSRITRVHLRVGGFAGVSPVALQFYFDAMRDGQIGPQAELVVEKEPLAATCRACFHSWTFDEPSWACPGCGAAELNYKNGMALDLVAIEVNDAADDPDRRENPREE